MFLKKNMFKGKVGIFEIKNNKINHILNFYKVEDNNFKKIYFFVYNNANHSYLHLQFNNTMQY